MTLTTVDAFASRPFTGNPAAVCVLDEPAPEGWMQALAAEMNLSETAFVVPAGGAFGLRWFTPTTEVDLCGHATLAAAHVLFETGRLSRTVPAQFDTLSGRLMVTPTEGGEYTMDFPATPPAAASCPEGFPDALDVSPVWYGTSQFDHFAVLESEEAVRSLTPDPASVGALGRRGVIVTARADTGRTYDVVSRFFAPAAGVPEDPVTGSAHCAIGPYWAAELGTNMVACYQASARGGHVAVHIVGDRVRLTGPAVTVLRAELSAPTCPTAS